jgi:hypothetical protein
MSDQGKVGEVFNNLTSSCEELTSREEGNEGTTVTWEKS